MAHRFSTLVSLSMMVASAILLNSALPAKATVEDSLVPAMPSVVTFTKGTLKVQDLEGELKLVIKKINIPAGTPGTLVLSLMINDAAPEDVEFDFVVKGDAGAELNKIKLKISLADSLGLAIGDVVKVLRAEVIIEKNIVAVPGIVIEAKEDVPDADEAPVQLTASGTYTFDAGVLTLTTTASEFECGLEVGTEEFTVPSITSTTMILEDEDEDNPGEVEQTILTRESGTDGDIVGTWEIADEADETITFEADGSFSLVGEDDCEDED